jgi:hypothetical protein
VRAALGIATVVHELPAAPGLDMPPVSPDVPGASMAVCAVALGCALQVNFGQYAPAALLWVTVALVGGVLCVTKPDARAVRLLERRRVQVLSVCLAVQFILLLTGSPGATGMLADESHLLPFRVGVVVAAAVALAGVWVADRWRRVALAGLLLVHVLLGLWVLRAAPDPGVDVCLFQREAAEALLRGDNPYAITFADPYRDSSRFYGPGVSQDGRLAFGYPYPPLSLLLVAPAHLLGDFRYAHLAAMTIAAAFVAVARPGRTSFAAAAMLLFTPRGFFVLEAGWTEPLAVVFLAATVFCANRFRRRLSVPLGLLAVSKQYLPLALLATPLLAPMRRSLLIKVAAVAALVTLPLALWNLPAFLHSAVLLQFRQPFRPDALSYLVPLSHLGFGTPPAWLGFLAAGAMAILALRRCPRTPAGFAAAGGLILLAFFAFNKQAFCNYYHLVIGAFCCAAGASTTDPRRRAI